MPGTKDVARECALTREQKPAADLIRFVAGPDDVIVPDVDAKAPGRGVWVTLGEAEIIKAADKNVFARSLKQKVVVPADLAQMTRSRLEQRLTGALGLARKAGQLVTGATRVKSAIESGTVLALLTASDAAFDGRRKMLQAIRATGQADFVQHFDLLSSDQMSLALGQENVIHAALLDGAAAQSAMARAQRLARFMAKPDERTDEND